MARDERRRRVVKEYQMSDRQLEWFIMTTGPDEAAERSVSKDRDARNLSTLDPSEVRSSLQWTAISPMLCIAFPASRLIWTPHTPTRMVMTRGRETTDGWRGCSKR